MAESSDLRHVHLPRMFLAGGGAVSYLLGLNAWLMSYSKDERFVRPSKWYERDNKRQRWFLYCSLSLLATSAVLILLSVLLYDEPKEPKATTATGLLQQVKQSSIEAGRFHEVGLLNGVALLIVLTSMGLMMWNFHTTGKFHWSGMLLYSLGWLTVALSYSTDSKLLENVNTTRLAWTLPGTALLVGGTLLLPWDLQQDWLVGPTLSMIALGLMSLTAGHIYVS